MVSLKVDTKDPHAWAGIWASRYKDDERGFFDNMSDRPIKINEWQSYTVEGTINANSKSLSFEVYVFTMVNSILIKSNYL
jgi:hypothetical protein